MGRNWGGLGLARSQEFHPGHLCEWQRATCLGHLTLLISKKLDQKQVGLDPRHSHIGVRCPKQLCDALHGNTAPGSASIHLCVIRSPPVEKWEMSVRSSRPTCSAMDGTWCRSCVVSATPKAAKASFFAFFWKLSSFRLMMSLLCAIPSLFLCMV